LQDNVTLTLPDHTLAVLVGMLGILYKYTSSSYEHWACWRRACCVYDSRPLHNSHLTSTDRTTTCTERFAHLARIAQNGRPWPRHSGDARRERHG